MLFPINCFSPSWEWKKAQTHASYNLLAHLEFVIFEVGFYFFSGWMIEAEGLVSHDVACHGVGARTGPTTDSSVFANSTLTLQTIRIAKKLKSRMLSVKSSK